MCSKEKCCKNCKYLGFYDCYLCLHPDIEDLKTIDNLKSSCYKYKERNSKFWLYENAPF